MPVSEEVRTFSSQAAREADLWLKQRVYDLGVFANSSAVIENMRIATELDNGVPEEARGLVRDYLESVEQRVRGYDGLRIVDTESLVVAATGTTDGLTLDPDLPEGWLDAFREDRPALGEPRRGSHLPGDGSSVGVPIRSSGGDLFGGLFATLNLQPMGTVLAVYSPGENGSVYVVTTASERILGGQMTTESMGTVAREQVVSELIALGGSSRTYAGDSGEEVTGAGGRRPQALWGRTVLYTCVGARGSGLRRFPWSLPPGSACPPSGSPPLASAVRSPSPAPGSPSPPFCRSPDPPPPLSMP